jgi:hypothetical protein
LQFGIQKLIALLTEGNFLVRLDLILHVFLIKSLVLGLDIGDLLEAAFDFLVHHPLDSFDLDFFFLERGLQGLAFGAGLEEFFLLPREIKVQSLYPLHEGDSFLLATSLVVLVLLLQVGVLLLQQFKAVDEHSSLVLSLLFARHRLDFEVIL